MFIKLETLNFECIFNLKFRLYTFIIFLGKFLAELFFLRFSIQMYFNTIIALSFTDITLFATFTIRKTAELFSID